LTISFEIWDGDTESQFDGRRQESSKKRKRIRPAKCEYGVAMSIIELRLEERNIFYLVFFTDHKSFKSDFRK